MAQKKLGGGVAGNVEPHAKLDRSDPDAPKENGLSTWTLELGLGRDTFPRSIIRLT